MMMMVISLRPLPPLKVSRPNTQLTLDTPDTVSPNNSSNNNNPTLSLIVKPPLQL